MSAFADWFREQHGPRESSWMSHLKAEDLDEMQATGKGAQTELDRRALWDAKYNSALYAWQAAPERQKT